MYSVIDGSEKDASEADMTESVASDATQRESRNARTTLSGTYELKVLPSLYYVFRRLM